MRLLVLGLCVGVAAGWWLGRPDAPAPVDPESIRETGRAHEGSEATLLAGEATASPRLEPTKKSPPARVDRPTTSTADDGAKPTSTPEPAPEPVTHVPSHLSFLVAHKAEAIRAKARAAYDRADVDARELVARVDRRAKLKKEEAAIESARGGIFEQLEAFDKGGWKAGKELVASADAFGAWFRRHTEGGDVDVRGPDPAAQLEDGDTLDVPRGVWRWSPRALAHHKRRFPQDLLIEGAGIDASMLVLTESIRAGSRVHNLTFRDLTVHTRGHDLIDVRGQTLRFERCRVIGFDRGAGGSSAISGAPAVVFATDCIFEVGFGRSPTSGNLFDVRGHLLARFERCILRGPMGRMSVDGRQGFLHYQACRFERMAAREVANLKSPHFGVVLEACEIATLTEAEAKALRRATTKPVSELNRDWKLPKR